MKQKTSQSSCQREQNKRVCSAESSRASKAIQFLEAHQSDQPSTFTEDAKWRQENEVWLRWSRGIALSIVDYMQENGLTRSDIANKLGVSPQYVSRILSGSTNFPFKSVAEIERKLGISCMEAAMV